ncbi:MAG TPA: lysylphosphatidylglycerol synthase transmembrane domain-containing protein [Ignavibacteriaceae bacterium]|nr:lysylphosphatidylglycerol synthase transmembrane domain-containing protein [Ignavibacteriaceae bacterium]
MLKKIRKKLLISIALAGLLYLGFTIYAETDQLIFAFKKFNWLLIPIILLLTLFNYFARFLKWHYYLSLLEVKIKIPDSILIFFSGFVMSITPGKMGELLKSYLVKEVSNTPISKTAPIILLERLTDFVSLIVIAIIGAYFFEFGKEISVGIGIIFFGIIIILSNRKLAVPVIKFLEKIKFLHKYIESFHSAYESSYKMLRLKPLTLMLLLSTVAWFFECLGYHIILSNFGVKLGMFWASFAYAFSTVVGAITMLPGGLGATEGSLTFLVIEQGFSKEIAVASTFLVRVVTLWFAVLIGIISVTIYQIKFGKISVDPSQGETSFK